MNQFNILAILYRSRWRLAIVSLAAGIATGLISLLSPNRYSSTAAISIQHPEVPVTGEVSPLRVEALRSLIESTRVKRELFDRLREDGRLEERIDFRRFQRMLSTRVQHVEGRDRALLPMVRLTATSSDPALSAEIANRWAEVVLDQTRDIYRSGVNELREFTRGMYEEATRSLLQSEDRYAEVRLDVNLETHQLVLKHNREVYSRILQRVLELENQSATGEETLRRMEARLAEQELEGIWIGEFFSRDDVSVQEVELPASTPLTERIARTIRSLDRNEEMLADFEKNSQIELKRARVKVMSLQIDEISRETMKARVELSSLEPAHRKLQKELQDISPTITLKKSIGDELLLIMPDRKERIEELPQLQTEVNNPVYEEIKSEALRLSAKIEGLKSKIEQGEDRLEELRNGLTDLNREIASLSARQRVLQSAIERDRNLLEYYAFSYREERREFEQLKKELELAAAKLEAKNKSLSEIAVRTAEMEAKVYRGDNAISRQKREVDNLTSVHRSLASRAEEMELLRVSMENVSRSGTVLLYGAEIDPVKVGPHRPRTVLIAALLAFLLYSAALALGEAVRQYQPAEPGRPGSAA